MGCAPGPFTTGKHLELGQTHQSRAILDAGGRGRSLFAHGHITLFSIEGAWEENQKCLGPPRNTESPILSRRDEEGSGWPGKGWPWDFHAPPVFWALSVAPGKVDLVGERMGAGEGSETPFPSHADLRPKHRRLCECRITQPPAGCWDIHRQIPVSVCEKRDTSETKSFSPEETLGKRLSHLGTAETPRGASLGLWGWGVRV